MIIYCTEWLLYEPLEWMTWMFFSCLKVELLAELSSKYSSSFEEVCLVALDAVVIGISFLFVSKVKSIPSLIWFKIAYLLTFGSFFWILYLIETADKLNSSFKIWHNSSIIFLLPFLLIYFSYCLNLWMMLKSCHNLILSTLLAPSLIVGGSLYYKYFSIWDMIY